MTTYPHHHRYTVPSPLYHTTTTNFTTYGTLATGRIVSPLRPATPALTRLTPRFSITRTHYTAPRRHARRHTLLRLSVTTCRFLPFTYAPAATPPTILRTVCTAPPHVHAPHLLFTPLPRRVTFLRRGCALSHSARSSTRFRCRTLCAPCWRFASAPCHARTALRASLHFCISFAAPRARTHRITHCLRAARALQLLLALHCFFSAAAPPLLSLYAACHMDRSCAPYACGVRELTAAGCALRTLCHMDALALCAAPRGLRAFSSRLGVIIQTAALACCTRARAFCTFSFFVTQRFHNAGSSLFIAHLNAYRLRSPLLPTRCLRRAATAILPLPRHRAALLRSGFPHAWQRALDATHRITRLRDAPAHVLFAFAPLLFVAAWCIAICCAHATAVTRFAARISLFMDAARCWTHGTRALHGVLYMERAAYSHCALFSCFRAGHSLRDAATPRPAHCSLFSAAAAFSLFCRSCHSRLGTLLPRAAACATVPRHRRSIAILYACASDYCPVIYAPTTLGARRSWHRTSSTRALRFAACRSFSRSYFAAADYNTYYTLVMHCAQRWRHSARIFCARTHRNMLFSVYLWISPCNKRGAPASRACTFKFAYAARRAVLPFAFYNNI